jgi:hypothetical protein
MPQLCVLLVPLLFLSSVYGISLKTRIVQTEIWGKGGQPGVRLLNIIQKSAFIVMHFIKLRFQFTAFFPLL